MPVRAFICHSGGGGSGRPKWMSRAIRYLARARVAFVIKAALLAAFFIFGASNDTIAAGPRGPLRGTVAPIRCDERTTVALLTQARGPFGQELHAQEFQTENGSVWTFGTDIAMRNMDPAAVRVRDLLRLLTGESTDHVFIARAITGSLARLRQARVANDFDFEALMIARVDRGSFENLHDPGSIEVGRLAQHFQWHVESVLRDHPEVRFIELKAGEYRDPSTGEMKGVKWWLEHVRQGWREVQELNAEGQTVTRRITLREAFATDARIKSDWSVPAEESAVIPGSRKEASVLYRVGMQVRNNQPRMRESGNPDYSEALPVRATTLALDAEDMMVMLEASRATPSMPVEQVHQMILRSIHKYQSMDHLKVIKRVFALMQFWDNVADFNLVNGTSYTPEYLNSEFLEILQHPEILVLSELRAQAEHYQILEDHRISLEVGEVDNWVEQVRARYGIRFRRLDLIADAISSRIDDLLDPMVRARPHVRQFVEYVTQRVPYAESPLMSRRTFLAMRPTSEFVDRYRALLQGWRARYPELEFESPEDLHMTIHFMGLVTEGGLAGLRTDPSLQNLGEGWILENGGATIMGRNNQVLAVRFEAPEQVQEVIQVARARLTRYGVRSESRFRHYVPHITIARIRLDSQESRRQAQRFLSENLEELERVRMSGARVWARVDRASSDGSGPLYEEVH